MLPESSQSRRIGRYLLYGQIASGGMASVHFGRLVGEAGFSRTVAIKRLHPQLLDAPDIAASLLDEARLVSRIQHPNVVATLDLIETEDEAFLVMDYIRGESLARLLASTRARSEPLPLGLIANIVCGVLHGLHAAHEAHSESGEPLGIVHRDVSPENVLVGGDGVARLLDFGIAKARGRLTTTRSGQVKGKIPYMAPEQLLCGDVTRRTDIYSAGIVLWEALTMRRLFQGADEGALMTAAIEAPILPPSTLVPGLPPALDEVVLKALERNVEGRYPTARAFAVALEQAVSLATPRELGEWVEQAAGPALARRDARVANIERASPPESERAPSDPRSVAEEMGRVVFQTEPSAMPSGVPSTLATPVPSRPLAVSLDTVESSRSRATPRRTAVLVLLGAFVLGSAAFALFARSSQRSSEQPARTADAQLGAAPHERDPVEVPSPTVPPALPVPSPASSNLHAASAPSPPSTPPKSAAVLPVRASAAPARSRFADGGARPKAAVDPKRCQPPYTVDATRVAPAEARVPLNHGDPLFVPPVSSSPSARPGLHADPPRLGRPRRDRKAGLYPGV